jgi:hypothetical protein
MVDSTNHVGNNAEWQTAFEIEFLLSRLLLRPPSPIPKRRLTGRLSLRDGGDPCTAAVSRRVSVAVFPGVWLSLVRTGIVGSAAPDETLMLA